VVDYHIEALKKKRDRKLKQARKNNCATNMAKVKELDATIKKVIKRERARIIKNKMKDCSARSFWQTINTFFGRSSGNSEVNIVKDCVIQDSDSAAQLFIEFFRAKVDNLVNRNPIQDFDVPKIEKRTAPFTQEEIDKAMATFKPKKSSGPDEVPMLVLKSCYDVVKQYILEFFKAITMSGQIPSVWRIAKIKPIHKKGDTELIENYRPICNLNSVSKLFERCILNRVAQYDTDGKNQHGFKSAHSTTTAAIELQDTIARELDQNRICLVYSTDLSAAFDLIRPGIFLSNALEVIPDHGIVWLMY